MIGSEVLEACYCNTILCTSCGRMQQTSIHLLGYFKQEHRQCFLLLLHTLLHSVEFEVDWLICQSVPAALSFKRQLQCS